MAFLEFIFQSFWHFAGVTVLVALVCMTVIACVLAISSSIEDIGR